MKESARAARDEVAHNRSMAALEELLGANNDKVKEFAGLRMRRLPTDVRLMMEREILADVLEDLAQKNTANKRKTPKTHERRH